jgi:hypothetical protein
LPGFDLPLHESISPQVLIAEIKGQLLGDGTILVVAGRRQPAQPSLLLPLVPRRACAGRARRCPHASHWRGSRRAWRRAPPSGGAGPGASLLQQPRLDQIRPSVLHYLAIDLRSTRADGGTLLPAHATQRTRALPGDCVRNVSTAAPPRLSSRRSCRRPAPTVSVALVTLCLSSPCCDDSL